MPESGRPRVARAAKIQWALVVMVLVGLLIAAALDGGSEPALDEQRSVAAPDRIFREDMARQAADASRLAAQAAGSPRLADLARRIELEDRRVVGRRQTSRPPARNAQPAADARAVRDAIRRHIAEDRIIARIGLEAATSAPTRRAAASLLRTSRDWTVGSQD